MRGILAKPDSPVQFSGHETFPLRQLWLRKAYDAVVSAGHKANRTVFADEDAIVRFGVGKNMVASIRHWALACCILEETDGGYRATDLAHTLFGPNGLDPYCEHPATAWHIHWMLAGKGLRSTTWVWLFNYVTQQSFDREYVLNSLKQYVEDRRLRVSDATLKRDIECCIRGYVPRLGGESPEEVAEPVLGELGLIQQGSKGTFEFRRGAKHTLPDGIFAVAILDFWKQYSPETATLSFDVIAHEYGSPGRVFKLDENSVSDRVLCLEHLTGGRLVWSDTAGMKQIIRLPGEINTNKLLEAAYG